MFGLFGQRDKINGLIRLILFKIFVRVFVVAVAVSAIMFTLGNKLLISPNLENSFLKLHPLKQLNSIIHVSAGIIVIFMQVTIQHCRNL